MAGRPRIGDPTASSSSASSPVVVPELVSVIVPTYDDAEYLERAITSVLEQTYAPVEVIVIDSSSDQEASDIVSESETIRYLHRDPRGPGAARNRGIDAAWGEYIAFLDADDEWLPTKLERQIETLQTSDASIAFSNEYQDRKGSRRYVEAADLQSDEPHVDYFMGGYIGSRTVVVRRECFEDHRFDESLKVREDPHLWVRLLRNYESVKVDEPLAIKHVRPDSLTSDPTIVYENECDSVSDLCDRFPELAQYREKRLWQATYRCANRQVRAGDRAAAREKLGELWRESPDERVAALYAVSYLPWGTDRTVTVLGSIYRTITTATRR